MKIPSVNFAHEFLAMRREVVEAYGANIDLLFRAVDAPVKIQDKFIVNNPTFISGFPTYCGNYGQKWSGLGYWGVTIIPHESLLYFIEQIKNDKNKDQLSNLLLLCQTAWEENLDIIHNGI